MCVQAGYARYFHLRSLVAESGLFLVAVQTALKEGCPYRNKYERKVVRTQSGDILGASRQHFRCSVAKMLSVGGSCRPKNL